MGYSFIPHFFFFFELPACCRPAWRGDSWSPWGGVHSTATVGAQVGAGDEDVHPRRSVYQSWEVLPGQVLQGLGWGQSASSRQSLGTEGSRLREGGTLASSTGRG